MHRQAWALVVGAGLVAGCFSSPPRKKEGTAPLRTGEDVALTATRAMRAREDVKLVKYATSEDPENAPKAPVLSEPKPAAPKPAEPKPVAPTTEPPATQPAAQPQKPAAQETLKETTEPPTAPVAP